MHPLENYIEGKRRRKTAMSKVDSILIVKLHYAVLLAFVKLPQTFKSRSLSVQRIRRILKCFMVLEVITPGVRPLMDTPYVWKTTRISLEILGLVVKWDGVIFNLRRYLRGAGCRSRQTIHLRRHHCHTNQSQTFLSAPQSGFISM